MEPNCGAEEDLVCSDFVGSRDFNRLMNDLAVSADIFGSSGASDNNLNKPHNTHKTGSDFVLKSQLNCEKWIKSLMEQPKSLSDEVRHRDCLTRALTVLCKEITENTVIDCFELDLLISENCIAEDDKMYIDAKNLGTMQRTRRLLSLILLRDYKTLLTFLTCLLIQNQHVVEKVLLKFQNCMQSNYRKATKCTLCHLVSRVDMSLIVDDLLTYDENWLPFYRKVSQAEYIGPSKEAWQELIGRVGVGGPYEHISEIVLKALRACGFHSDIVLMLQVDRQMGRDSFVCRCGEVLLGGSSRQVPDSQALLAPEMKSAGKMFHFEQNNTVGKRTNKLSHSDKNVYNIKERSSKTGHSVDINKDTRGKQTSMKNLFYESKGRELQILLKGKQNSSNHFRQVQTITRSDKEKTKRPLDSKGYEIQHETELLKPYLKAEEYKMETLKGDEWLEEQDRKDLLKNHSESPGRTLIQMELLKIGVIEEDEEEKEGEHEWSVSTLHSNVSCEVSEVQKMSTKDYPPQMTQITQHKIELLKTDLWEEESDRDFCEQEMTLLKIGIHEYESDQVNEISYSRPSQDYDGSFNSVMRSSGDESVMDTEVAKEEQKLCQPNKAEELEIERQISNLLIVLSFLVCFLCSVMQCIYSIF